MAKMDMKQFMKDSKREGSMSKILNLKEKGKLIVFLHPETGIESRKVAYIPTIVEVESKKKKGKKEKQVSGKMIILSENYENCPIRQLTKALRDDDNLSMDDVIFEVGEGKGKVEILKGDIIGEEGYDWKRRIKTTPEYVFGAVDKDDVAQGTQILIAPKSLGKAITKVIENQMEQAMEGEEDADMGDPFKNPYAFKLMYDENEQPSLMYQADYFKAKVTKEIKDLLADDGIDIEPLTKPTKISEIVKLIEEILVADIEGYDLSDFSGDDEEEEEEKPKKNKKASSKKSKKVEEEDEEEGEEEDSEDDEEDEEEEEKPKKSSKKDSKKASKTSAKKSKKVEEEDEEEDEDDEEEEEKPKKSSKKDSKKTSKTSSKKSKKVEEEDEEEDSEEDEEEEEKPKKSSKKDTKKKGKKVEEEDEEEDDEEEEEKPKKSSKEKGKKDTTSKSSKASNSGKKGSKKSNQVECPACGEMVDEDATECPECGAEFDDESVIICPDCGHENPEDALKCKKCKTELTPF